MSYESPSTSSTIINNDPETTVKIGLEEIETHLKYEEKIQALKKKLKLRNNTISRLKKLLKNRKRPKRYEMRTKSS